MAAQLVRATVEQETVLANLLELYAHDFSEFSNLELGPDGRFGYPHLSRYWTDPKRHPFLILVDGNLAGLVLVKRGSETSPNGAVWDMAEFFVVRGYRRRGIGIEVAHEVWNQFAGFWEVRVLESNNPALQFWGKAITAYTGTVLRSVRVEKAGKHWRVFMLESKGAR